MPAAAETRFADLYRTHRSAVWLYCRRRLDADRADDAMGDVFLTAWRRLDTAPEPSDALPWLYRIAHLTISNHWRTVARRGRLQTRIDAIGVSPPEPVADQVVARDEVRVVVDVLNRLKPSDVEILRLTAWEHLNTSQVSAVLDITPDAAKQRLARARRRLTRLYNKEKETESNPPMLKERR